MRNASKAVLFGLCLLWQLSCQPQEESFVKKIDKTTLQQMAVGKEVQLIDVRTPEEYENGRIDDALNFNVNDDAKFLDQISTLNKDEPVYIYCKMGGRSNRAAELMKQEGFKKIYEYSGGYNDWSATN
ncbi:rhodanese-like domain-containing protein [Flagellimonas sp.]|uniref:rhodanese-like domain-containing protein n=1 Tax=Flagellimonas sp. TaxID=2058762 RepID=UPI003B59A39E